MSAIASSIASLKSQVVVFRTMLGDTAPKRLRALAPEYHYWSRQLVRIAACPDLDSLAAAIRGLDALRDQVEALHRIQRIEGIRSLRKAFAGVEHYIDTVQMPAHDEHPAPDELLDLPTEGLLGRLMSRFRVATEAVAPPDSVANVETFHPRAPSRWMNRGNGMASGRRTVRVASVRAAA